MKKILAAALLAVGLCGSAQATNFVFSWDANTEADLVGYKMYCALSNTATPPAPPFPLAGATNTVGMTLANVDTTKHWYCAVTAYNLDGLESAYSNIVHVSPFMAPAPPKAFIRIRP